MTAVHTIHLSMHTRTKSCRKLDFARNNSIVCMFLLSHFLLLEVAHFLSLVRVRSNLLPIRQRVDFKLSVLVFNCLNNLAPSYLSTTCQPVADNAGRRHLRSAARCDLAVPATRTVSYGPRSFAVAGPSMWNSLPVLPRNCHLPSSFRRDLKTELFIRAYHQHACDCL